MNELSSIDMRIKIEKETGFLCYEKQSTSQKVFFGTSDKLAEFKALAEPVVPTGTIAYCMDTGTQQMWSAFKKLWY